MISREDHPRFHSRKGSKLIKVLLQDALVRLGNSFRRRDRLVGVEAKVSIHRLGQARIGVGDVPVVSHELESVGEGDERLDSVGFVGAERTFGVGVERPQVGSESVVAL